MANAFCQGLQIEGFGQHAGAFEQLAIAQRRAFIVAGDEQHLEVGILLAATFGQLAAVQAIGQADVAQQQVRAFGVLQVSQGGRGVIEASTW